MVSEKKWLSYLDVQASGLTNMWDVPEVVSLANKMNQVKLTKRDCYYIMKNYGKLKEKFGIGGVNIGIQSIK